MNVDTYPVSYAQVPPSSPLSGCMGLSQACWLHCTIIRTDVTGEASIRQDVGGGATVGEPVSISGFSNYNRIRTLPWYTGVLSLGYNGPAGATHVVFLPAHYPIPINHTFFSPWLLGDGKLLDGHIQCINASVYLQQ